MSNQLTYACNDATAIIDSIKSTSNDLSTIGSRYASIDLPPELSIHAWELQNCGKHFKSALTTINENSD